MQGFAWLGWCLAGVPAHWTPRTTARPRTASTAMLMMVNTNATAASTRSVDIMTSPSPSACACLLEKKPTGTRHASIYPKELLRRGERLGARLRGGRTILGGQEWGQAFR